MFEHERLRFDRGEKRITKEQFEALERFHGSGTPYFNLVYNGVQFKEYVGVLQVGNTLIEVLPKADRRNSTGPEETRWRNILIDMMRAVGELDVHATSEAHLQIRPNTILDLYFERFIRETEYLLHTGLARQYRTTEGNSTTLKGSLQFPKQVRQNAVHQERFYVRHTVYDSVHPLHMILYKTIQLLRRINTHAGLHSRIGALLLNFPEMPDIRVNALLFEKLVFNRSTHRYRKAIDIAKLILLNHHPDLSAGRYDVLALMFDMNLLWERFLFATLRRLHLDDVRVSAQVPRKFWKPVQGKPTRLLPDILIEQPGNNIILDTKWKNLKGKNPSPEDLRQVYVYHDYFEAKRVALVYPADAPSDRDGWFWSWEKEKDEPTDKACSVVLLAVPRPSDGEKASVRHWQEEIRRKFQSWLTS